VTEKMEAIRGKIESEQITQSLLVEEKSTFLEYHKAMHIEEEKRRIKSRSLWLQVGDKNTKHFHRGAKSQF
jgi:hypothetical protein